MSGLRLRNLLEDNDFFTNLQLNGQGQPNQQPAGKDQPLQLTLEEKTKLLAGSGSVDPASARLLNSNIWDDSAGDDFNLEYMDLDEFLTETGLIDASFNNLLSGTEQLQPQQQQQQQQQRARSEKSPRPAMMLEQLLSAPISPERHQSTSPLSTHSDSNPVPIEKVTHQSLHHSYSTASSTDTSSLQSTEEDDDDDDDDDNVMPSAAEEIGIVKKRKYKEDGEGLTDTSVVVVPGKDGFDPACAKFDPEELQPQPIIKKSKKQFVPEESKDEKYWKRRNKNNVAAKRSREARRARENQIIMRAGFLEKENGRLSIENAELIKKNEELMKLVEKLKAASK